MHSANILANFDILLQNFFHQSLTCFNARIFLSFFIELIHVSLKE
jgi:hypothetical protein